MPELAREAWLEARRQSFASGVFSRCFTLPAQIHDIVRYNERLLYGTLFQKHGQPCRSCVRQALPGQYGMVAAILHGWGQNLHYHPHIHCIVPGGGLKGGKWVSARGVLSYRCRPSALFQESLSVLCAGTIKLGGCAWMGCALFSQQSYSTASQTRLMAQDWVVYAKPRLAEVGAVAEIIW